MVPKLRPQGFQKAIKMSTRKRRNMFEKNGFQAVRALRAKRVRGVGVPPTVLLRRTTIQAKPSKLTRANKLSQAKPEPHEHSTCARGTVADIEGLCFEEALASFWFWTCLWPIISFHSFRESSCAYNAARHSRKDSLE